MRRKSNRLLGAFTLVELLVVVSIIALLIAILLPSLKNAREQAKTVQCLSNVRSMAMGVGLYAEDHRQILPGPLHPPIYRLTAADDDRFENWSSPQSQETTTVWFLLYRLAPYFSKTSGNSGTQFLEYAEAVATCPTAIGKTKDADFVPADHGGPADNPRWSHPFNYLPNSWSYTEPESYFGWVNIGVDWEGFENGLKSGNSTYKAPLSRDRVKRASDEWMIGDAWRSDDTFRQAGGGFNVPPFYAGTWPSVLSGNQTSDKPLPRAPYHGASKNGTNLVYFDGHAETFKKVGRDWVDFFIFDRYMAPKN